MCWFVRVVALCVWSYDFTLTLWWACSVVRCDLVCSFVDFWV